MQTVRLQLLTSVSRAGTGLVSHQTQRKLQEPVAVVRRAEGGQQQSKSDAWTMKSQERTSKLVESPGDEDHSAAVGSWRCRCTCARILGLSKEK